VTGSVVPNPLLAISTVVEGRGNTLAWLIIAQMAKGKVPLTIPFCHLPVIYWCKMSGYTEGVA